MSDSLHVTEGESLMNARNQVTAIAVSLAGFRAAKCMQIFRLTGIFGVDTLSPKSYQNRFLRLFDRQRIGWLQPA
jgi:hypothetical protein